MDVLVLECSIKFGWNFHLCALIELDLNLMMKQNSNFSPTVLHIHNVHLMIGEINLSWKVGFTWDPGGCSSRSSASFRRPLEASSNVSPRWLSRMIRSSSSPISDDLTFWRSLALQRRRRLFQQNVDLTTLFCRLSSSSAKKETMYLFLFCSSFSVHTCLKGFCCCRDVSAQFDQLNQIMCSDPSFAFSLSLSVNVMLNTPVSHTLSLPPFSSKTLLLSLSTWWFKVWFLIKKIWRNKEESSTSSHFCWRHGGRSIKHFYLLAAFGGSCRQPALHRRLKFYHFCLSGF